MMRLRGEAQVWRVVPTAPPANLRIEMAVSSPSMATPPCAPTIDRLRTSPPIHSMGSSMCVEDEKNTPPPRVARLAIQPSDA